MMPTRLQDAVKGVEWGLVLAVLAIFLGFAWGGAFGLAEETLKSGLKANAATVFESAYRGDPELVRKTVDKSWVYYQRAHLHWAALGTAALAQILLLALLTSSGALKFVVSTMLGVGAVGYGAFWLWAGTRAPGLGGTTPAKASLAWLGLPSAGLCLLGTLALLVLMVRAALSHARRPRLPP
jgi:ABC-type amino acid transport system permease subunit